MKSGKKVLLYFAGIVKLIKLKTCYNVLFI